MDGARKDFLSKDHQMTSQMDLQLVRQRFADDIAEVAPVLHNRAILDAFSVVRREDYLGKGRGKFTQDLPLTAFMRVRRAVRVMCIMTC